MRSLNDIVEDYCFISRTFTDIMFDHIGREGNHVAHGLAVLAQSLNFFHVPTFWMEEVRFSIISLRVVDDLN